MTWLEHHRQSEQFAARAAVAKAKGDVEGAKQLYGEAAAAEAQALDAIDPSKRRTMGITAVSAVALYYKAAQLPTAKSMAHRLLANDDLPEFAKFQLRDLLQMI